MQMVVAQGGDADRFYTRSTLPSEPSRKYRSLISRVTTARTRSLLNPSSAICRLLTWRSLGRCSPKVFDLFKLFPRLTLGVNVAIPILDTPARVNGNGLQIAAGGGRDPHIRIAGRNGEMGNSRKLLFIRNAVAFGVLVPETLLLCAAPMPPLRPRPAFHDAPQTLGNLLSLRGHILVRG